MSSNTAFRLTRPTSNIRATNGPWSGFIPFCDVIFTVVSLTSYLCVIIFDAAIIHALYNLKLYQSIRVHDTQKRVYCQNGPILWFWLACTCLIVSSVVIQIVSMNWCSLEFRIATIARAKAHALSDTPILFKDEVTILRSYQNSRAYKKTLLTELLPIIILHILQLHVVWRHCKIFISPSKHLDENLTNRQRLEFCRLSIIRLYQTTLQCLPMFLLKSYILISTEIYAKTQGAKYVKQNVELCQSVISSIHIPNFIGNLSLELLLSSASLSLFNLSWSLATYDKAVFYYLNSNNTKNCHGLHFTWLGIILKTLSNAFLFGSRSFIFLLFAFYCINWALLIGAFHWLLMIIYLYRQKLVYELDFVEPITTDLSNLYLQKIVTSELSCKKSNQVQKYSMSNRTFLRVISKFILSLTIGNVYIFVFFNFEPKNLRLRITTYYILMFIENTLMVTIWLHQMNNTSIKHLLIQFLSSYLAFFLGIIILVFYYRCLRSKLKPNHSLQELKIHSRERILESNLRQSKMNHLHHNVIKDLTIQKKVAIDVKNNHQIKCKAKKCKNKKHHSENKLLSKTSKNREKFSPL